MLPRAQQVPKLKNYLVANALPTSGNKAALIDRITKHIFDLHADNDGDINDSSGGSGSGGCGGGSSTVAVGVLQVRPPNVLRLTAQAGVGKGNRAGRTNAPAFTAGGSRYVGKALVQARRKGPAALMKKAAQLEGATGLKAYVILVDETVHRPVGEDSQRGPPPTFHVYCAGQENKTIDPIQKTIAAVQRKVAKAAIRNDRKPGTYVRGQVYAKLYGASAAGGPAPASTAAAATSTVDELGIDMDELPAF